ncbi:hypothetical protein [Catenovulum agarivorans]|nr:hypothetical protein [Catenovulum agarivorans]
MNQPPIAWMQSASDHGRLEAFGELTATSKRRNHRSTRIISPLNIALRA